MNAVAHLLKDLNRAPRSDAGSARVLVGLTDLLLDPGQTCSAEGLAVFDVVIDHYVSAAALQTRADLAQRLADATTAPPNVLLTLAFDEIAVAAPILKRSRGLADVDLMALAATKGRDHLLAICERHEISEEVSDILVGRDDLAVSCAVADNPGARLSHATVSVLVEKARVHDGIGDGLGARADLSAAQIQDLVDATRERERERLSASLPGASEAPRAAALRSDAPYALERAGSAIARLAALGRLDEAQVVTFAREGRQPETIAALSHFAGLPPAYVSGLFTGSGNDLLLAIARSLEWSWDTCGALMRLRQSERDGAALWRARNIFETMPVSTARQAVRFVQARSVAGDRGDPTSPELRRG